MIVCMDLVFLASVNDMHTSIPPTVRGGTEASGTKRYYLKNDALSSSLGQLHKIDFCSKAMYPAD